MIYFFGILKKIVYILPVSFLKLFHCIIREDQSVSVFIFHHLCMKVIQRFEVKSWLIYFIKHIQFQNVFFFLCFFSFIVAIVNKNPCLWNSGAKRLRETWGGLIRNRICMFGGPIWNRLCILGRPIGNHLCILGGLIRKPYRT